VQWNGAAENRVSYLGKLLFGTDQVGALGRNSGEVLGVFGHAIVPEHEGVLPQHYRSTVKKGNLLELEESLKRLWSPEWPDEFGALDADRRDRGAVIFEEHCQKCHTPIDRDDPVRTVAAVLASVDTDTTMIDNFLQRRGKTGRLEGRRQTLTKRERFEADTPVAMILKHVVERVILRDLLSDDFATLLANTPAELHEPLNPGYESTAFVQLDDEVLAARLSSLVHDAQGNVESLTGGEESVGDDTRQLLHEVVGARALEVTNAESLRSALPGVKRLVAKAATHRGLENVPFPESGTATVTIGYKARPLNGVWATAPYLHNGSVPTLAALLTPPAERKAFHVGSRRFDPVNVGYVSDPEHPLFDPREHGNSNLGHDFGTDLTTPEKLDLIEYLKSL
jgi:hypothetical protein